MELLAEVGRSSLAQCWVNAMRTLEIVVALIVAVVAFVVLKVIGVVIHIALVVAAIGFVGGFLIARMFRRD
jgi:multisubunit Na+/H+ antiporter MnhF subunit